MTDKHESERDTSFDLRWRGKLARALDGAVGEETRRRVMKGAEKLTAGLSGDELIGWTRGAMGRLEKQVGEDDWKHIMTQCACQYPKERLEHMRRKYAETRDLNLMHRMLQEQFLATTKDFLGLDDGQLEDIQRRGWGVAGVREGDTIVATKMPFEFHRYFEATTPKERRYRFCHCQGVREVIRRGDIFPKIYCYCGAGFYRGIWEHILQRPVKVEVLDSVLCGGDFCRIAIHLPHDA
jgi:hypothetical protein